MNQELKASTPASSDNFPLLRVIAAFIIVAILEVYILSFVVPDDHIALSVGSMYSDYVLTDHPTHPNLIASGKRIHQSADQCNCK